MKKFLTVLAVTLFISNGFWSTASFAEVEMEGEFEEVHGLPKAQKPDIENKLADKKAAVHTKMETKKAELGITKDVSLSSLGISEAKVRAKMEEVKPADIPEVENTDEVEAIDENAFDDVMGAELTEAETNTEENVIAEEKDEVIEDVTNTTEDTTDNADEIAYEDTDIPAVEIGEEAVTVSEEKEDASNKNETESDEFVDLF